MGSTYSAQVKQRRCCEEETHTKTLRKPRRLTAVRAMSRSL